MVTFILSYMWGFGTKMPTDSGWFLRRIFQKMTQHSESQNNIVPRPICGGCKVVGCWYCFELVVYLGIMSTVLGLNA